MDHNQEISEYRKLLLNKIDKSIENCKAENLNIEGKSKLIKLLKAEKSFLNKKLRYNEKDLQSTNYHFLADLQICLILLPKSQSVFKYFRNESGTKVRVDIVAENGLKWVKVVSKNTKALESMIDGSCNAGRRSLKEQIKELKTVAEYNKCKFKVPQTAVIFFHDIPPKLFKEITCLNVEINQVVDGELKDLSNFSSHVNNKIEEDVRSSKESEAMFGGLCHVQDCVCKRHLETAISQYTHDPSDVKDVNLDVSSMITLVSNQCHDYNKSKFKHHYLSQQAEKEKSDSALLKIMRFLIGKRLLACKTAVKSFEAIVKIIAGENEKKRASKLVDMLIIEEDQSFEKNEKLSITSRINDRCLTIFGTGDSLKAVTCTSNAGFIRAARQAGVKFVMFAHEPRSLSEQKEVTASELLQC